jgi:uncharacterized protein (DUF849 family)
MGSMGKKTVLTCAITGAATRPDQTPYLPITPEQIANSALEAAEAGAAVAHIHVRDVKTGRPSMDINAYRETVERIRERNPALLINLTTGPGAHLVPRPATPFAADLGTKILEAAPRVRHIELLKPDICSMDFNTMHLSGDGVRLNQIRIVKEMIQRVQAVGTKPELEIFDSGDLRLATEMLNEGIIQKPALWQIAMGIKYGWDASSSTLSYACGKLPPDAIWSGFGTGRMQMPMLAQAWIFGGHGRVGMEDNIYLRRGVLAKSNAELVRQAVSLIENLGGSIATPREARQLLGLASPLSPAAPNQFADI